MTQKPIRNQFADTMLSIGTDDPNLVVLVGDISHFILQPFAKACPGRYYNIGICEPTMLSIAAGFSKTGFHPVVHTIAPFIIERSFEQIKLDFCYQQLSGNLVTVGGVFDYSNLGCTHHCYGDFALLKTLPNTEIVYPSTALEFDTLFSQSYGNSSLTLFRIPENQHLQNFTANDIRFGKGIKLFDGSDLTLVVTGPQLENAVMARDRLISMGWKTEILYIHTVLPLDIDLIMASVGKTRRVMVIEEHMQRGGLGDDILREIIKLPDVQFSSLSIPDKFVVEYGSYKEHCDSLGLNYQGILNKVKTDFIKEKR